MAGSFETGSLIAVPETLRALGDIAGFWRNKFTIPVVGVTGSNGKTTTKELIAFLLEERFNVLKSPGNFNNLVGLPLTLLGLGPSHHVVLLEMGTNVPGEIRRLAQIARPTVGLITNIGQAHLEGMGSLENVVREKGELFRALGEDGVLVVNRNDSHVSAIARDLPGQKVTFGIGTEADVMVEHLAWEIPRGVRFCLTVRGERVWLALPFMGLPLVHSVAAAVAVASVFEMTTADLQRRLERFKPLPMRMEVALVRGVTFLNDAYNANPPSVEMAVRTLSQIKGNGQGFVVLGDMLELGEFSDMAHRRVGHLIGTFKLGGLFLLGDQAVHVTEGAIEAGMASQRIWTCKSHREIADRLRGQAQPGDWILVKGSRRMQMERVIENFGEEN
jgi:UDP-N-acetylmuramoyl-tripeptide--D-alanyl-D-alanine ligase